MPPALVKDSAGQIQKGYRAVPIAHGDARSAMRLCIIVRDAPDTTAGIFVLLRDDIEAAIYLGCFLDAGGYVHQWLELWIQNINELQNSLRAYREAISNAQLDERWSRRAAFLAKIDRANKIELPYEALHPLPLYFDLAVSNPVNPVDSTTSAPWELCMQDYILEHYGLPKYSTSLARYLTLRGTNAPPFVPVTAGAPENDSTQDPKRTFGALIPLNPDGGLMMARKLAPLTYEAYAGLLSGQVWKGVEEGTKVFKLAGVYETLQNAEAIQQGGAHFFMARRGSAGALVETFQLKLNLILQAFKLVRDFIREQQLPLLNLSADSFRVSLAETSPTLPVFWTAKVSLATMGSAFALPIETSEARYFVTPSDASSIYRPVAPSAPVSARGAVRIRKLVAQPDETVVLEGTISTQERLDISPTDLLWIRLTLSSGRVDLYANLTEGLAQGEQRFRTLPQKFPEHINVAIRSAEGVRFPNVPFETLPLRSSPCDLYTLAAVAARTLLTNEDSSLAVALDELSSLAQSVGNEARDGAEVAQRVRSIAAGDPRWAAALGPHLLLKAQAITVDEALTHLPGDLWWDAIALIIQCLPGAIPASFCSSLGDAPPLALHNIFEPPIAALEKLIARARGFLFVDWKYNSEIHSVLQAALQKHLEETGAP